jgi:hypothetical protein
MFLVQRKCDLRVRLAGEPVAFAAQAITNLFISVQFTIDDRMDVAFFVMEWLFAFGV